MLWSCGSWYSSFQSGCCYWIVVDDGPHYIRGRLLKCLSYQGSRLGGYGIQQVASTCVSNRVLSHSIGLWDVAVEHICQILLDWILRRSVKSKPHCKQWQRRYLTRTPYSAKISCDGEVAMATFLDSESKRFTTMVSLNDTHLHSGPPIKMRDHSYPIQDPISLSLPFSYYPFLLVLWPKFAFLSYDGGIRPSSITDPGIVHKILSLLDLVFRCGIKEQRQVQSAISAYRQKTTHESFGIPKRSFRLSQNGKSRAWFDLASHHTMGSCVNDHATTVVGYSQFRHAATPPLPQMFLRPQMKQGQYQFRHSRRRVFRIFVARISGVVRRSDSFPPRHCQPYTLLILPPLVCFCERAMSWFRFHYWSSYCTPIDVLRR